jgi:hypothetical protein
VAAFLISFGGLIGKVNPCQLMVLVVFEAIFYGLNKIVMEDVVGVRSASCTHARGTHAARTAQRRAI